VEAEMRADMMLVDEYSKSGWEIGKEFYWKGGSNKVEIDMLNLEKGIVVETKSGLPKNAKTLEEWLTSDKFKDWLNARVTGLKNNGLLDETNKFKLMITKEMLGSMSKEEAEELLNKMLRSEGINWEGEIGVIEW